LESSAIRPPFASIILQPRQPLPGILDFGEAGVGVFPLPLSDFPGMLIVFKESERIAVAMTGS